MTRLTPVYVACLALLLAWVAGPGLAHADEPLGRLFHTPQRRAMLDELRRRNIPITPEQRSENLSLQGIVRRSDGRSTVWINGRAHQDGAPVSALGNSSARIPTGDGHSVEIKVGQQLRFTDPQPAQ